MSDSVLSLSNALFLKKSKGNFCFIKADNNCKGVE